MFLHSGASLHGHEFSKRKTQAVANGSNRRNPLLRSAFPPPANRASTLPSGTSLSRDNDAVPDLKKSRTDPEPVAQALDTSSMNSPETQHNPLPLQLEAMSEDETSIISDASKVSSSVRRKRRSGIERGTTYVLAHPPPKLRTKQRIIHVRPNLVLQIQQVAPGSRPIPTIDVYPSFAGARSIMAPLLGRVPGIAGIKRELSGQDIMLVKSEDYASHALDSESEYDENSIMARDLLAVLSPSKNEDKTEIVMADGTVWVATTRSNGNSYSYEFTSIDTMGTTITARWVRKHTVSSSLPATPTSPKLNPAKPQLSDTRFTFSILDPRCRRHPILATLTSTSLIIPETYTTVDQSTNRFPSRSESFSPPSPPSGGDQSPTGRSIQPIQEWQKSFISISAVWVALRHGWAPGFRPEDFMPSRTLTTFQPEGSSHGRRRSLSASADSSPSSPYSEATGRRKYSIGIRQPASRPMNDVPRRATSTGAAFMQKRRGGLQENNDQPADSESDRISKLGRRALSGDWSTGLSKSAREHPITESIMDVSYVTPKGETGTHRPPTLAPPPMPVRRRAVSAYLPLGPLSPDLSDGDILGSHEAPTDAVQKSSERVDTSENSSKCKHRKWKNMTNWFRKLSER
ncbi:hypothetical protein GGS24DRAFT_271709 [Hypoxylon argillaceum]|nr:hypothetical protein GGS24DRAFT_271709 [Hypoxylon argillaceum]KAI1153337.1 hypothetical protein F4825DRAFT_269595 [Nemania diffusa]